MNTLFSVIIPSYNHAPYLRKAVQSALNQTVDLELIVIDDGSRDDSLQILDSLKDDRLQVIAQQNAGAHAALNRGIGLARGEFIAILNSDDVFLPNRLSVALRYLRQRPDAGLVGSYISVIDEHDQALGTKEGFRTLDPWLVSEPEKTFKLDNDLRTALLMQNYWATTSNYIMPIGIFKQYGPFRELRYVHDWDLALRIQLEQPAILIEEPLLSYRVHQKNTIRENQVGMMFEICWLMAVHLPRYLDQPWFWQVPPVKRFEQLLHSIYVHGCERVLLHMLLLLGSGSGIKPEELLQLEHPIRHLLLEQISYHVNQTAQAFEQQETPHRKLNTEKPFLSRVIQLLRGSRQ